MCHFLHSRHHSGKQSHQQLRPLRLHLPEMRWHSLHLYSLQQPLRVLQRELPDVLSERGHSGQLPGGVHSLQRHLLPLQLDHHQLHRLQPQLHLPLLRQQLLPRLLSRKVLQRHSHRPVHLLRLRQHQLRQLLISLHLPYLRHLLHLLRPQQDLPELSSPWIRQHIRGCNPVRWRLQDLQQLHNQLHKLQDQQPAKQPMRRQLLQWDCECVPNLCGLQSSLR